MPIESLTATNFRSYKKLFLEFSSGITAITGENDVGKSNILRMFDFVINNRPSGNSLRSNWGGDTIVAIDTGNKLVSRIKTNTENLYALTHADGNEDVFRAFGKKVPDLIIKYLNINSVNFSLQLDRPFLLGKSAADVAKYYNEIVHLEIIDKTITNIASTLRKERADLESEKEIEKEKTEKLKEYDWLPGAEKEIVKLELLQQNINDLKNDQSVLQGLTAELKGLEKANQELEKITKFENTLLILIAQDEEINNLQNDYNNLSSLINELESLVKTKEKLKQIVEFESTLLVLIAQDEKIDNLQNDYNNLSSLIDKLESLIEAKEELNRIVEFENQVVSLIEQSNQITETGEAESEFAKYIDLLKGYQEAEKHYNDIIKFEDNVKALLVLDGEIEGCVIMYNSLQDLLSERLSLSQKHEDIKIELTDLELKFKNAMLDICPIFSVECKYIKEAKL
jgi:DNA repair protein RecN (Recombination protein N)